MCLLSMNVSVVGGRLFRCGVDVLPLPTFAQPMTYFLLQAYLCGVYDHNMLQQIMLPFVTSGSDA